MPLAQQGIVEPAGWPEVMDAPLAVRAYVHDRGSSSVSRTGLTAWFASKALAMARLQRLGGVMIEAEAPEGSVWYNYAARGAECQVLVPGRVQGKVVAKNP